MAPPGRAALTGYWRVPVRCRRFGGQRQQSRLVALAVAGMERREHRQRRGARHIAGLRQKAFPRARRVPPGAGQEFAVLALRYDEPATGLDGNLGAVDMTVLADRGVTLGHGHAGAMAVLTLYDR